MIQCFLTMPDGTHLIEHPERGCWVNVVNPTEDESRWLIDTLHIEPEFVRSALDDEERSHADYDDDSRQALIIIDCPFIEEAHEAEDRTIVQYDTHPLSFIFLPEHDCIVTISMKEDNDTIRAFSAGKVRQMNTRHRTKLLLQMLLHISKRYIACLRSIDRQFAANEKILRRSMNNSELIKMLGFEKSLVYFSSSLKSVESTIVRISSGRVVRMYEEDHDLLDDVLIEIRQATEMCSISASLLNGTMDTFSSIISNNLNLTIRTLTIITLVFAIPTIIFSFYGMNVEDLPGATIGHSWLIPFATSMVLCIGAAIFLFKSRFLK